jgi:hypothetical protein
VRMVQALLTYTRVHRQVQIFLGRLRLRMVVVVPPRSRRGRLIRLLACGGLGPGPTAGK